MSIDRVNGLLGDLRHGARLLRLSPGFTLVAVLSLALGIGANTAIFQLLDAVRLRSLPIARPHELAEVKIVGGNGGMGINPGRHGQLTRPLWEEIQRHQQAFSGAFAWASTDVQVGAGSELRRAKGLWVSGDFLPRPGRPGRAWPADPPGGRRGLAVAAGGRQPCLLAEPVGRS